MNFSCGGRAAAREAPNLKVEGASPSPAINYTRQLPSTGSEGYPSQTLAVSDLGEAGIAQKRAVLPQKPCKALNAKRNPVLMPHGKSCAAEGSRPAARRFAAATSEMYGRDSRRDGTLNSQRPRLCVRSTGERELSVAALLGRFLPEQLAGVRVRLFSPAERCGPPTAVATEWRAGLARFARPRQARPKVPFPGGPADWFHGMALSTGLFQRGGRFFRRAGKVFQG